MTFQYRVRDPLGNTHEGSIESASADDAHQLLRRDGFQVLQLEESDEGLAGGLFGRRIGKRDLVFVTGQLAVMVDTGITLSSALGGIIEQEENPALRSVLTEIKNHVEGGEDFSTALARFPRLFDKTFVSLVKASEATGTLGPMLQRITDYLSKEVDTRARVRAAMAYPLVMMCLALGVTIFLLTYILPKFTPLFEKKGTDLPRVTELMMGLSKAMIGHWYLWLAGTVLLVAGFLYGKRTDPGRRILDWVKINLPILGPMFRKVIISRSIRTLGTMIGSGVPMLDAIKLAGDVSANYYYENVWQRVHERVTTGKQIHEALAGDPLFPRVLVQMIGSGEEAGKLDFVLQRVSTYFDREVDTAIKTVTSLIEPLMIAAMGFVVGGIALALLLPIFQLSRHP